MSEPIKKTLEDHDGEAGFSLIETLPLIIVMSSLIGFLLGLWGLVHKNILASIASRNYAFETFNNRSNLIYFNDVRGSGTNANSYEKSGIRFHGYGEGGGTIKAFTSPYRFPATEIVNEDKDLHRKTIWNPAILPDGGEGQEDAGTKSPWVLIGYGMCLDTDCGGG